MERKNFSLIYINSLGEECQADFRSHEYHSLMELLFDKYLEEWGDCKGRSWCGTCHIQIIGGTITETMDTDEIHTLSKAIDSTPKSRLACQIPVTAELDGLKFRMAGTM